MYIIMEMHFKTLSCSGEKNGEIQFWIYQT